MCNFSHETRLEARDSAPGQAGTELEHRVARPGHHGISARQIPAARDDQVRERPEPELPRRAEVVAAAELEGGHAAGEGIVVGVVRGGSVVQQSDPALEVPRPGGVRVPLERGAEQREPLAHAHRWCRTTRRARRRRGRSARAPRRRSDTRRVRRCGRWCRAHSSLARTRYRARHPARGRAWSAPGHSRGWRRQWRPARTRPRRSGRTWSILQGVRCCLLQPAVGTDW